MHYILHTNVVCKSIIILLLVLETKAQSIVKRSDRDKEDLKLEPLKH